MKIKHIKVWQWIISGVLLVIFLALFFASTITKNWVEKNSQDLIGRKITITELHINCFKVSVQIKGFTLFEKNSKERFISFDELYINFDPLHLFKDQFYFAEIRLDKPYVYISQNKDLFNFSDLIPANDSINTDTIQEESTPLQFTLNNVKISDGQIIYKDLTISNTINLEHLGLKIPTISWNSKQANVGIKFNIGDKGLVQIQSKLKDNNFYTINLKTENINLDLAKKNLKQFLNINDFSGLFSSDLTINGEIEQITNILINGKITIDSLYISDKANQHLLSFDQLSTNISNIDLQKSNFHINSIIIKQPHISARLNKDFTNIEKVLGLNKDTTKTANQNQTQKGQEEGINFKLDKFEVEGGNLLFEDNTLNRKFTYEINQINISASNISLDATKVPVKFYMQTNQDGKITGDMTLNLKDPRYANLVLNIKKIGLSSLSPYSEYYIACPITKGNMFYDMKIDLTPTELKNSNDIRIERLIFGKKTKDSTAINAPIKLALYIIKDKDERIAFNLPVSGDPSKPGFKYSKILWQTLSNFFIKIAVSPFNAMSDLVTINPEKMQAITYSYSQDSLMENQIEVLDNIKTILTKKTILTFELEQHANFKDEKKHIAVSMAKEDFARDQAISPINDSTLNSINIYGPRFLEFVGYQGVETSELKPEDACVKLYSDNILEKKIHERMEFRNSLIKQYFKNDSTIINRIKYSYPDFNNIAEEEQQPYFKIKVDIE